MQIIVNTNNYGVEIVPIAGNSLKIKCQSNYLGFLSSESKPKDTKGMTNKDIINYIAHPRLNKTTYIDNSSSKNTIKLEFSEPEGGLAFNQASKVLIGVPYSVEGRVINYALDITTGDGNINLTNSFNDKGEIDKPLVVSSMNLTTRKGNANIKGIGDSTGEITDNLVFDNFNISTNGGKFDFSNFKTISSSKKILLDSENATYVFNTLKSYNKSFGDNSYSGGVEVNGKNVKFTANAVYCGSDGFVYKSETGVLKVNYLYSGIIEEEIQPIYKEVKDAKEGEEKQITGYKRKLLSAVPYENTIFTDSAVVELYTVVGKVGLYNEYGDVTINYLTHQGSLRTENGNIKINHSGVLLNEIDENPEKVLSTTSSLILHSTFGDILVNEYYQDAVIYSKKGKINAHSYFNNTKLDRYYYSNISTKDGKITMITEKNPVIITASGKNMNPFEHYMYQATTQNGNINVVLPMKSYLVNVQAKKITGSIGATNVFGDTDVQINAHKDNQPAIKLSGRNINLSSNI